MTDSKRQHLITVSTEHKAILDTVSDHADQRKYTKTVLPVNHDGLIDLELLKEAITEETLLVCIMMVNNETGTIQDIKKISDLVHSKGAFLLCACKVAQNHMTEDALSVGFLPD